MDLKDVCYCMIRLYHFVKKDVKLYEKTHQPLDEKTKAVIYSIIHANIEGFIDVCDEVEKGLEK